MDHLNNMKKRKVSKNLNFSTDSILFTTELNNKIMKSKMTEKKGKFFSQIYIFKS